jgi:hypothetical protein
MNDNKDPMEKDTKVVNSVSVEKFWENLGTNPDFKLTFDPNQPIPMFSLVLEQLKNLNLKTYGKKRYVTEFKKFYIGSGTTAVLSLSAIVAGVALIPIAAIFSFGLIPVGLITGFASVALLGYDSGMTHSIAIRHLYPKYKAAIIEWLNQNQLQGLAEHPSIDDLVTKAEGTYDITPTTSYIVTNDEKYFYFKHVEYKSLDKNVVDSDINNKFFAIEPTKKAIDPVIEMIINDEEATEVYSLANSILEEDELAELIEEGRV